MRESGDWATGKYRNRNFSNDVKINYEKIGSRGSAYALTKRMYQSENGISLDAPVMRIKSAFNDVFKNSDKNNFVYHRRKWK